jgi:hypothetical protein
MRPRWKSGTEEVSGTEEEETMRMVLIAALAFAGAIPWACEATAEGDEGLEYPLELVSTFQSECRVNWGFRAGAAERGVIQVCG